MVHSTAPAGFLIVLAGLLNGCAAGSGTTPVLIQTGTPAPLASQQRQLSASCDGVAYRIRYGDGGDAMVIIDADGRRSTLGPGHPLVQDLAASPVLFRETARCADDGSGLNVRFEVVRLEGSELTAWLAHAFIERDGSPVSDTGLQRIGRHDQARLLGR